MSPWVEVFGRLHPLVLHLPIGLLAGLAVVELVSVLRRRPAPVELTRLLVWVSAVSATLAAGSGYVLNLGGGYATQTVSLHLWCGVAVAVGASAAAVLRMLSWGHRAYLGCLFLTVAALVPTGHFGASLTHGEGFLLAPLRGRERVPPAPSTRPPAPAEVGKTRADVAEGSTGDSVGPFLDDEATFARDIAPILIDRCAACHGETKQKGALALHTREAIEAGSENGPVVVAGRPEESELLRRLRLPEDDRDHMPPRGKPQPAASEVARIADWIAAGAPFEGTFGRSATQGAETSRRVVDIGFPESRPASAPLIAEASTALEPEAPPPPAAVAALAEKLVHVQPVSVESHRLWVDFSAVARTLGENDIAGLLEPLKDHVAELSLARTLVSDALSPTLGSMSWLRRLDLRGTRITDRGVAELSGLPRLAELNLAQTAVTDEAVSILARMRPLRRVYLWRTGVSDEGLDRLREGRPDLTVIIDDGSTFDAVETEEEIRLSGDLPPPGAPGEDALKPVNSVCPVSGAAVNPRFRVVYEGRVIGFCCPHCPKEFWTDPGRYPVKAP